jgi:hypothetical protein
MLGPEREPHRLGQTANGTSSFLRGSASLRSLAAGYDSQLVMQPISRAHSPD